MRKTNLHLYSFQYSVYKKRDKFTFDIVSGTLEFKKGCELPERWQFTAFLRVAGLTTQFR